MITIIPCNIETNIPIEVYPVTNFKDIKECKRLFFKERGTHRRDTWHEVLNLPEFIRLEMHFQKNNIMHNCSEVSYIKWHQFHFTK